MGVLHGSPVPAVLLVSSISHTHVSTGAKAIFASKFKLFCHFRRDFQLSGVCIKGESIVELEVLGGAVGGGVNENCEYSGLVSTEERCNRFETLIYYFRASSGNMLQRLKSQEWQRHLPNVCKFLVPKGDFKNRL